jgi:hypothetical protein
VSVRSSLLSCGLALLTVACSVTRHGTLSRFPSGVTVPIAVVVDAASATVSGTNPDDGERLAGTFHATHEYRAPLPGGVMTPQPPMGGGAVSPGTGPYMAPAQASLIEMTGVLEGDKGTSLRCSLQIKKGLRLHGSGVCRIAGGEDKDIAFRIRF